MLSIVTPATASRLSTVPALREALGDAGAAADETALGALLDRASASIAAWCNRVFGRETVRETFRAEAMGGGLVLARAPVISIASAVYGSTTLAAEDYEIDAAAGILFGLNGRECLGGWYGGAVIEYTAGWLLPDEPGRDLPHDIEAACLAACCARWHSRGRDPSLRQITTEGVGSFAYGNAALAGAVPGEAAAMLAPWRRARAC